MGSWGTRLLRAGVALGGVVLNFGVCFTLWFAGSMAQDERPILFGLAAFLVCLAGAALALGGLWRRAAICFGVATLLTGIEWAPGALVPALTAAACVGGAPSSRTADDAPA